MNHYITIKKVQAGLYQAHLINGRPVMADYLTVLHSFTSQKQARNYIEANWQELKQYN